MTKLKPPRMRPADVVERTPEQIEAEIKSWPDDTREKQLIMLRISNMRLRKVAQLSEALIDSVFSKTAMGDYMVRKEDFEALQYVLKRPRMGANPAYD